MGRSSLRSPTYLLLPQWAHDKEVDVRSPFKYDARYDGRVQVIQLAALCNTLGNAPLHNEASITQFGTRSHQDMQQDTLPVPSSPGDLGPE